MNKTKINFQAELDRQWTMIRKNHLKLKDTLNGKKMDRESIFLSFECVHVVVQNMFLHKKYFEDVSDEIKEMNKVNSFESVLQRYIFIRKQMENLTSETVDVEKKQEIIIDLGKQLWNQLLPYEEKITNILINFFTIKGNEEIELIMRCLGIVDVELGLRDLEINLLEKG